MDSSANPDAKALIQLLALAPLYFAADWCLNKVAFQDGWAIFWPLNGATIALLISHPRSRWPWILLSIEFGTGIGELLDGNRLMSELIERGLSALEVSICALILPPFTRLQAWLRTPKFHSRLFLALVLGPGVSGLMAAWLSPAPGESFWAAFNSWATADSLGIATTLPLALSLISSDIRSLFTSTLTAGGTCLVLMAEFAVLMLIFSVSNYTLTFMLFPTLLCVDVLLGFSGSSLSIVMTSCVAVILSIRGHGPFGAWPAHLMVNRDLALQLYLGFHVVALLPMSALFMERRRMTRELEVRNEQLNIMARIDPLTGVANRRSFEEGLQVAWQCAIATQSNVALAVVDLDNFKLFNDIYGHPAGDACLRAVSKAMAETLRPGDLAARIGGEEFALLLPETTLQDALVLLHRVQLAVVSLNIPHLENAWECVTVSIGCACAKPGKEDREDSLLKLADAALYRAKAGGRNCIRTIDSFDDLKVASVHFGDTTRIRILRLLGLNKR